MVGSACAAEPSAVTIMLAGPGLGQVQPLEGQPEKLGQVSFPVSCNHGAQP